MSFKVNYSDAEQRDFAPLPEGTYEVVISEVEVKTTQAGADMLRVTYTIRDDVDQKGRKSKIWDNVIFMDSTKWRYQQFFKAVGLVDGASLDTIQDVAKAVLYKALSVKTKNREYEGKTYANVAGFYPANVEYKGGVQEVNPFEASTTANAKASADLPF